MVKVLIITKNLLAEQKLQSILQRSNEEVYCSSDLMIDAQFYPQIIQYFSLVIFSDTISTLDVSKCCSFFKKNGLTVIRKGNKDDLKKSEFPYLIDNIDDWITKEISDTDIIEIITKQTNEKSTASLSLDKERNKKNSELFFFNLSSNERKFLYHLHQHQKAGKVLSREKLCYSIWKTEVTTSNLCQLSNLANRIKKKLTINQFPDGELITSWNKGYLLGELLFKEIQKYMN